MAVWGDGNYPYDTWNYDSGYPSNIIKGPYMSSADFERLGNTIVATQVRENLNRANYIAALREVVNELQQSQQATKDNQSFSDWLFGGIADDLIMISETLTKEKERIKLMRLPMPRKISFQSITTTYKKN
jgi:hypothetical protein